MSEKKQLLDEALSKISGGRVYDHAYEFIDQIIELIKENDYNFTKEDLITGAKNMWTDGSNDWQKFSTDKSQEDLDELIAYIEKKWQNL